MVPTVVYATLRENRQLAYIEIVDDNSERMDLFLSIISLKLDENYTIAIPLRTKPTELNCVQMLDTDFTENHQIDKLDEINEKQNNAGSKFQADFEDVSKFVIASELVSLPISLFFNYLLVSGLLGGAGAGEHYEFEGVSVDIHSLDSFESVQSLYEDLNLPLPQNVNDSIAQYSAYHVAVVNATSKPPIPENEFYALQSQVPEALQNFTEFVRKNPRLLTYQSKSGDSSFWSIYMEPELSFIWQSISDYTLRKYFENLVLATYGIGSQQGYQLSFLLPLYNNQAYYPLGTSSSWNAISVTKVVFDTPDTKEIRFSMNTDEVFHNGRHYYIWEFENELPNYDLEGEVASASFGTAMSKIGHEFNAWVYDNSLLLAILTFILVNAFIWFVLLFFAVRFLGRKFPRYATVYLLLYSFIGVILSIILSIFIAIPIVLYLVLGTKEKVPIEKKLEAKTIGFASQYDPRRFDLIFGLSYILLIVILLSSLLVPIGILGMPTFILWGIVLCAFLVSFLIYKIYRKIHTQFNRPEQGV